MINKVTPATAIPMHATSSTSKMNDRTGTYQGVLASGPTVARWWRSGSRPWRRASRLVAGPAGRLTLAAACANVVIDELFSTADVARGPRAPTVAGIRDGIRAQTPCNAGRFGRRQADCRVCWQHARRTTVTETRNIANTTGPILSPWNRCNGAALGGRAAIGRYGGQPRPDRETGDQPQERDV